LWAWNNLYEHILNHIFDERRRLMQTAVVTLLLVVSAVLFACIVVEYAVSIFEQTLQTQNMPCMDRQNKRNRVRELEDLIINQTDKLLNQTILEISP